MQTIPRVISIEDDQGIFNLIKKTLAPLPVELYHAKSGREALDLVVEIKPDLLVLDIALPDIHGWDILKQVKQMNGIKPNVVVLTAHSDPMHRIIGHLQEVNEYICKPFVPAELRQSISTILGLV
ncbi:MAG: response regulator transcription factor [Anaerolineales bacterium]|nr:response regulator transcription factor [Anaerolineales bacterium]MCA9929576.1 response regulator transcription factor [Anaerolineales bacterium]